MIRLYVQIVTEPSKSHGFTLRKDVPARVVYNVILFAAGYVLVV